VIDIYAPHRPWPEGFRPLSVEEAVKILSDGSYPGCAWDDPDCIDRDVKMAKKIREFRATCALAPDGRLMITGTMLSKMQAYN